MKVKECVIRYLRLVEAAELADARRKIAWKKLGANERAQALRIVRNQSFRGPPISELDDSLETTDVDIIVQIVG